MSNAVIEAVVGLKVGIGSVPFWVRVSLWSGICQEMMCPIRADVYVLLYRWAHSYQMHMCPEYLPIVIGWVFKFSHP